MAVTNDYELYKKMLLFRTHGITREESVMSRNEGPWYYEQIDLGYNYRITDLQCALGTSQMNKIDYFISRRREIVKKYNRAFNEVDEVTIPYQAEYSESGWHLYILKLNLNKLNATRRQIFDALVAENIGVNVHYLPIYLHPYYQKLGYKKGICPEAERLYESMITIPLFPKMKDQDVDDVISGVKKVIDFYRKK